MIEINVKAKQTSQWLAPVASYAAFLEGWKRGDYMAYFLTPAYAGLHGSEDPYQIVSGHGNPMSEQDWSAIHTAQPQKYTIRAHRTWKCSVSKMIIVKRPVFIPGEGIINKLLIRTITRSCKAEVLSVIDQLGAEVVDRLAHDPYHSCVIKTEDVSYV